MRASPKALVATLLIPTLCVGGWYTYQWWNQETGRVILYNEEEIVIPQPSYKKHLINPNTDLSKSFRKVSKQEDNPLGFGTYECFKRLFPGAQVVGQSDDSPSPYETTIREEMDACLISESASKESNGVAKVELALKKGNQGFVMWTIMTNGLVFDGDKVNGVKRGLNWEWRAVKLVYEEDRWLTLGGYQWEGYVENKQSILFKTPKKDYLFTENESCGTSCPEFNSSWETFKHVWLWDSSKEEEQLFNKLSIVRLSDNSTSIFGTQDLDFETDEYAWGEWSWIDRIYTDDKWVAATDEDERDATPQIVKWYEPFKNQRGKWLELEELCSKEISYDLPERENQLLKTYCYIKS